MTATGLFLLSPKTAGSERWRATVTPLASIIGSGFLIVGPILLREYGVWAPAMMLALCTVAYLFGGAIRSNIAHFEPLVGSGKAPRLADLLDLVSSWALAGAYVISVTYYLNLLGAFAVSLTQLDNQLSARLVTTGVLCFIGLFGLRHGLQKLETLETGAVGLKLSIIAGLIVALVWYAITLLAHGSAVENPQKADGIHSILIAFGLIITVQGFETSRYLGEEHDAATRIATMKAAQWISTAIYVVYVSLLTWSFQASAIGHSETAIIGVTVAVAPVLPALLVVAALASQFSAAIADTAGCGGLVQELSKGRIKAPVGYSAVAIGGLILTWSADIFQIIAYASKAFALYYGLQCGIAAVLAWSRDARVRGILFASLACLALLIAIFGIAVE